MYQGETMSWIWQRGPALVKAGKRWGFPVRMQYLPSDFAKKIHKCMHSSTITCRHSGIHMQLQSFPLKPKMESPHWHSHIGSNLMMSTANSKILRMWMVRMMRKRRTMVQGYSLHIQVGLLEGDGLNAKAGNESLLMWWKGTLRTMKLWLLIQILCAQCAVGAVIRLGIIGVAVQSQFNKEFEVTGLAWMV